MKEMELSIKVPVYMTTPRSVDEDEMFGGSYAEMVQNVKDLLDGFSTVKKKSRNKTKEIVIRSVSYSDHNIKERPSLLLRIESYNTNINDGYFEGDKRFELGSDGKIGSDTNFVLLVPQINGIHPASRSCSFLMLVYEDPTKDPGSVSKLAKIVAKDILHQPVHNIKPETVLEEVRKMGTIPELQITYVGVSFDDDGDMRFRQYRTSVKNTAQKDETYSNVPSDSLSDLVATNTNDGRYQKRFVRFIQGKKMYKWSKDLREGIVTEATDIMKESAEMVYNMSTSITETELKEKVHEEAFIIAKLTGVLENVLNYD